MPASLEDLIDRQKSKRARELRRYQKVIERDFPRKIRFTCLTREDQLDAVCVAAERVAKSTYQRGLGVGFCRDRETLDRLRVSARQGRLRAYFLHLDETPSAFWIGTEFGKVFHADFTGFDADLKKYEPGTVCFLRMVDDLCGREIDEIDFGFGDAFFKRKFGTHQRTESTISMYAPTWRGVRINLTRSLILAGAEVLRELLAKTNLEAKLKTAWRDRLAARSKALEARPAPLDPDSEHPD